MRDAATIMEDAIGALQTPDIWSLSHEGRRMSAICGLLIYGAPWRRGNIDALLASPPSILKDIGFSPSQFRLSDLSDHVIPEGEAHLWGRLWGVGYIR